MDEHKVKTSFDLTTDEGRDNAVAAFDKYGWAIPYANMIWLARKAADWFSSIATIEAQKQTTVELIKAGRNNGVDTMKITLDQNAGLDFGTDVDGIPIKCKIGKNGHMTIDVTYTKA